MVPEAAMVTLPYKVSPSPLQRTFFGQVAHAPDHIAGALLRLISYALSSYAMYYKSQSLSSACDYVACDVYGMKKVRPP
jgi:hypothetical protein